MHITLHPHEISSALQLARNAHTAVRILPGSILGPGLALLTGCVGGIGPSEEDIPAKAKISLLLIEDNRLLREGIAAMLGEQPDLAVVATSPSADAVLPLVRDAKPQLMLLDSGAATTQVAAAGCRQMPLLPSEQALSPCARGGSPSFKMPESAWEAVSDRGKVRRRAAQWGREMRSYWYPGWYP
jgi:hypothetical protein